VHGHDVRMKVGPHGAKPEYDDVIAVAARTGLPARIVAQDASRSWSRRDDGAQDLDDDADVSRRG